jgi:hypothetical protein
MDVRLSAPSGPLKRPKRLGGRATEAKWAQRKQLPLPLGLSVHQSHDFILLAGRPATARPPPSPRPPPASAGTPSCLRRDAALPPPGRRRASVETPPCLRRDAIVTRQILLPQCIKVHRLPPLSPSRLIRVYYLLKKNNKETWFDLTHRNS